jgi:hypothetical protein
MKRIVLGLISTLTFVLLPISPASYPLANAADLYMPLTDFKFVTRDGVYQIKFCATHVGEIQLPESLDRSALVASFEASNSKAYLNGVLQISGKTPIAVGNSLNYVITDGVNQAFYQININPSVSCASAVITPAPTPVITPAPTPVLTPAPTAAGPKVGDKFKDEFYSCDPDLKLRIQGGVLPLRFGYQVTTVLQALPSDPAKAKLIAKKDYSKYYKTEFIQDYSKPVDWIVYVRPGNNSQKNFLSPGAKYKKYAVKDPKRSIKLPTGLQQIAIEAYQGSKKVCEYGTGTGGLWVTVN